MNFKKSCAVALILVMTSSVSVFATENVSSTCNGSYDDYEASIIKYIERNSDGTLKLDVPSSEMNTNYNQAVQNLEVTNEMIKSGYLEADIKCNITVTDKYVEHVKSQVGKDVRVVAEGNSIKLIESQDSKVLKAYRASKSSGVNKITWTTLGFDLYLNSSNATKVAVGGATAAGVLALWFPASLNCKIVVTALLVYSGAIASANSAGSGVIIRCAYGKLPPLPPAPNVPYCVFYWVKAQ